MERQRSSRPTKRSSFCQSERRHIMSPARENRPTTVPLGLVKGGVKHPFSIDVEFHDGLTQTQQQAFRDAADRWLKIIGGGGPPRVAGGGDTHRLLFVAQWGKLPHRERG